MRNILIGICLSLFILNSITGCKSYFIFFPDRKSLSTPDKIGILFQSVYFVTEDRIRLNGWWIPSNRKGGGIVLFCHGNAGNISHRLESIKIFHRLGLGIFIFDYRGYGKSRGKPSEKGTYLDAAAAWRYIIKTRHIPQEKVIIFGRSLGGSIAGWLAQNHKPALLILESTFFSLSEVAAHHSNGCIAGMLFGSSYTTHKYIKNIECPLLIIHSKDDELIPFSHGEKLFNRACEPKEFLQIRGSHNNGFMKSIQKYERGLDSFIFKYIK